MSCLRVGRAVSTGAVTGVRPFPGRGEAGPLAGSGNSMRTMLQTRSPRGNLKAPPRADALLRELALGFIALPAEQIDGAVAAAQARILQSLGVERSLLLELSDGEAVPAITHSCPSSWRIGEAAACRQGKCSVCRIVWRGEVVQVPDDASLFSEPPISEPTCALGLQSVLGVPLSSGGKVFGAALFGSLRKGRAWPAELVGNLKFAAQVFSDALARKRAEEKHWRENMQYGELLELVRAIVWRADATTFQNTYVSKATETILGYPREDWLKPREFWADRIHPEDRDRLLAFSADAVREKGDYDFEHRMLTADGRTVWLRNVVRVVVEDGKPKELVGVDFDITQRKELEEKLREREAFISSIFRSKHSELVVLDKTGAILEVNDAWTRFAQEHGTDPAAVSRGANYLEVCRKAIAGGDTAAAKALEAIEGVLNGSRQQVLLEYPCQTPTGQRWFAMRVKPFQSSEGGAVIVHADITQLRETQDSLREALAELERLKSRIQQENVYLLEKVRVQEGQHRIVGESAAIRHVLEQAQQVATTDSTVLILGETGTGKELLAAYIHELSARRGRAMVSVNCAAMPGPLVESELFGREKGAFTGSLSRQAGRFELANDSTIFLDEIGELSLEVQSKLLRALETKRIERLGNPKPIPVNVRIIAATNQDLAEAIQAGRFRQDLYYRLNVFPLTVPPLRDRREDIRPLVWAFVDEFARTFKKNIEAVDRDSLNALQRYTWPGNIRELRNVIERAMIVATGHTLRIPLPAALAPAASVSARKLEEVERDHVLGVLEQCGWRIRGPQGAAARLGLKPTTLEARMVKLGIRRPA